MKEKDIDKIAQAIAAKLGEAGGPVVLGCGDASSSQQYSCDTGSYSCSYYECGGAGNFDCARSFRCSMDFDCYTDFDCSGSTFDCHNRYNE